MIKRLIYRPIAVTMVVIAIVIMGIFSMRFLPVSLMPDIDIPQITIQVSAPGMSVREIDNNILKSMKNQLSRVVGLKNITAEARIDAGVINMTFEPTVNIDVVFIDVNEKLDRMISNLPDGVERPKILKASITDIPAFYLNISLKDGAKNEDKPTEPGSDFTELGEFARDLIAKRIEQLPQTAMVDISGVVTPEYLCIPNYEKLTSMGVGVELLENAINENNVTLGSLTIKDGAQRYAIHFDSRITTKEDIENIYLNHEGRIYQFKELCEIVERPALRSGMVRSSGTAAVTMAIIKQSDAKMDELQESITNLVANFEKEFPDINFEITRDQTKLLAFSISNLQKNLFMGAFLAVFIIFLFMRDLRSPMLIIITIPLSLIVTMMVFHLLGISLNIISLSGLILGVGMMVDNSIIVIDNILQRWRGGARLDDSIAKAVGEVFTPMLSSVLTTCSVFLPLIFMSGTAGALFYDQAMAVTIALFSSLVVSVLVLPVYFFSMYRKKSAYHENKYLAKMFKGNFYKPYEASLKWVMRRRGWVLLFCVAILPLGYIIYNQLDKNQLPDISYDDTMLTIDWNSGISFESNDERIFDMLKGVEAKCEQITSMIGVQQFAMSHTKDISPSQRVIYLKTADAKTLEEVQEGISSYLQKNYPAASYEFDLSGNIFSMIFPPEDASLIVQLHSKGGDSPTVEDIRLFYEKLAEKLPSDIALPPLSLEQNIVYLADVEAMAMYNVKYQAIHSKMKNIVSQNALFRINRGGYSIPVTTGDGDAELRDIMQSKVRNSDGAEVPLSFVVRETKGEDFKKLFSDSGGDYFPIMLNVDNKRVEEIIEIIEEAMKESNNDFYATYKGGYFDGLTMVKELVVILIISVLLLYFILAAQFESIVQPFIILSEVIIDVLFVMAILWLSGVSLNIMSMIGLVVMSGIIINDSILKVDTIKPIIMTSLTTILAILPFLNRVDMGSELQYPLSLTIVVGMTIGTVISVLYIPVLYYTIYSKQAKRK